MAVDPDTGEVIPVFLRTAHNYDMDQASFDSGLVSDPETRAQQQFKDECDINVIVERFGLTGELPQNLRVPVSGDFADLPTDYQSALNLVLEADAAFMQMPAAVRARFRNDPHEFVEFVSDVKNKDEARQLGILVPEQAPPEPMKVLVVDPEGLTHKKGDKPA